MAKVKVYNSANTPVIIEDGRTLGGSEWHEVTETPMVSKLLTARHLVKKKPPHVPSPSPSVPTTVEKEEEPEVVLDEVLDETPVEAPSDPFSPATISKGRRSRKPSPNKE